MTEPIRQGQVWVCMFPKEESGIKHVVTSAYQNEVTTWSQPFPNDIGSMEQGIAGFSWLGPVEDFRKCFRPFWPHNMK